MSFWYCPIACRPLRTPDVRLSGYPTRDTPSLGRQIDVKVLAGPSDAFFFFHFDLRFWNRSSFVAAGRPIGLGEPAYPLAPFREHDASIPPMARDRVISRFKIFVATR